MIVIMNLVSPVNEDSRADFRLRQWGEGDSQRLCEICSDADIRRFTSAPRLTGNADARKWIRLQRARARAGRAIFLAIVPKSNERAVGSVNVIRIDYKNLKAELGYWLEQQARGRGLATLSLKQLSRHCFEAYHLRRLELYVTPENKSSQGVAERCNYTREGLLRCYRRAASTELDLFSYSLLADDLKWRNR